MPQVIIEQPGVPPMTVPLQSGETRFGRSEQSDVVLVAEEISRHHAKIVFEDMRAIVYDQKSLNGTYVNRQRVHERVLSHLDEVWLGSKCRLIFRDDTQIGRRNEVQKAEPEPASASAHDSDLLRNMRAIQEEMDRVGSSMTMIGRRRSSNPGGVVSPQPGHAASPQPGSVTVPGTPAPVSAPPSGPVAPGTPAGAGAPDVPADADTPDLVKMGQAYGRLAALYRASQIMAGSFELDQRLSDLLDLALDTMEAERGFVMLREMDTDTLTVRVARRMGGELSASSPSMGIAGRAAIEGEPVLMADRTTDEEFGMRESVIRHQICSAMCVPLRVDDRVIGSIYIDSRQPQVRFGEGDLELFHSLASQSALAIDHVRLHQQVVEEEKKRQNLGRFLSPAIVDQVMQEESTISLGGSKQTVTTMFCDIRGSTRLGEQLSPPELLDLLNEHFTAMTEIVFAHQGTLDKYIGDELMAVFGAPLRGDQDTYRAVAAGLAMVQKNNSLNAVRARENRPTLELGIGINTGEVIAGYMGSPKRMEFTVVGDAVNTAKRFCDMAESGMVVVGEAVYEELGDAVTARPIGTAMLKGKAQPTRAFHVFALSGDETGHGQGI